jgi:hypothetical protein
MKQNRRAFIATTGILGTGLAASALPYAKRRQKRNYSSRFLLAEKSCVSGGPEEIISRFGNT